MQTRWSEQPVVHSDPQGSKPRMALAGHLEELRRRLGVCLLALLVAVGISVAYVERIIAWLSRPVEGLIPQFAYFTPTEPLVAYIRVAILCGLILAMPVILWQVWAFLRSGLTSKERSSGLLFVAWGSVQFLAGAAAAYYGFLPASLRVLLSIGRRFLLPVISIDQYLGFVTTLVFWTGLVFELPVVLMVLAKLGIVTAEWLRQQRPYAVLVLVIIAALVTPTTDPVNLFLLAVPLILLYELSIFLTRLSRRARA